MSYTRRQYNIPILFLTSVVLILNLKKNEKKRILNRTSLYIFHAFYWISRKQTSSRRPGYVVVAYTEGWLCNDLS